MPPPLADGDSQISNVITRHNWPEINWRARILSIGKEQALRLTGIPAGTLKGYLSLSSEPSYRNGLMVVELSEGNPKPSMIQVDWFRVICDLKRIGITTHRVAAETAIPYGTVAGFKAGAEPRYSDGEILIEYYRAMTRKSLDQVPQRPIEMSASKVKQSLARKERK